LPFLFGNWNQYKVKKKYPKDFFAYTIKRGDNFMIIAFYAALCVARAWALGDNFVFSASLIGMHSHSGMLAGARA
jgi:hypothetical protein